MANTTASSPQVKVGQQKSIPPGAGTLASFFKRYGIVIGIIGLVAVCLMPTPEGLPVAGKRMLAILSFSVIVWMSDSISYPVSAAVILALMAFLLGLSPNVADPTKLYGTSNGLTIALGGFANPAVALVGAALFLAAAMMYTGLDKRIALSVLSKIGAKTNRVLIGVILVGFVLSFFVPSTTARVSCLVPIVMGIIVAFGVDLKSKFAGVMMIATAQADSLWNVGIKTASAQNMIAVNFIEKMLGKTITWPAWFIAAAPFSAIMSVVLYFVLMKTMPPETKEIAGGKEAIARALAELGPMKTSEKKLLILSITLLFFWATEKIIHPFDTSSTTIAAIALMLLPGIGIMTWKEAQSRIGWGTLMLFGVGVSLGSALLSTKAAAWLAKLIVERLRIADDACLHDPGCFRCVSDHHSPRLCQRNRTVVGHHPHHHLRPARCKNAGDQHSRPDDGAAVCGQLRFYSSGQCTAEHGGLRH